MDLLLTPGEHVLRRDAAEPLLANAGAYDVSGDLVTIRPIVAKIPVVMKAGANEAYRFRIEGKTLTLQQVRNARGVTVAQAATLKFIRVE